MSSAAAMLNRQREAYHHDEFLAFTADPAQRTVLLEYAKAHAWPEFTVHEGGVSAAIQFLVTSPSPRRLVVDLGESQDPVTAVRPDNQQPDFRRPARTQDLRLDTN